MSDKPETTVEDLAALAGKATPMNLMTAEVVQDEGYFKCAMCNGTGQAWGNGYINLDGVALNIQFSGIGNEFKDNERFFLALLAAYRTGALVPASERDALQRELGQTKAMLELREAQLEAVAEMYPPKAGSLRRAMEARRNRIEGEQPQTDPWLKSNEQRVKEYVESRKRGSVQPVASTPRTSPPNKPKR